MFSPGFSEDTDADHAGPADGPYPLPTARVAEPPILDLAKFQLLEDQLDDPLIARTFAGDFAKLWGTRYDVLAAAVERRDAAAALDAILSLGTSSSMVGGVRLALLARRLEVDIRSGDLRAARPLLDAVAICGRRTVRELRDSYVLRNG